MRPSFSIARLAFQLTLTLFLAVAALPATSAGQEPVGKEAGHEALEPSVSRLDLRLDPLVELYFTVRAQAARKDAPPLAGQEAAVEAARRIQKSLGSFGGWGPLDSHVLSGIDAATLKLRFESLEDPMQRFGREVSVRDDAVALAKALEALAPGFTETLWPERRKTLEAARERLGTTFLPEHRRALAFMLQSLGIDDPGIEVPVYLVTECHPPGASTYHLSEGEPASVVSLAPLQGPGLLEETILHESTHALDLASQGKGSAFETLRDLLGERGVERRDRRYQDVPHVLMFVQAEATMRRIYDPDHVGYGAATDLYQRFGEAAEVERRIWPKYLDGQLERDEALRQIVDELVPAKQPAKQPAKH